MSAPPLPGDYLLQLVAEGWLRDGCGTYWRWANYPIGSPSQGTPTGLSRLLDVLRERERRLADVLRRFAALESDAPCQFVSAGDGWYCHEHGWDEPCAIREARALLAELAPYCAVKEEEEER